MNVPVPGRVLQWEALSLPITWFSQGKSVPVGYNCFEMPWSSRTQQAYPRDPSLTGIQAHFLCILCLNNEVNASPPQVNMGTGLKMAQLTRGLASGSMYGQDIGEAYGQDSSPQLSHTNIHSPSTFNWILGVERRMNPSCLMEDKAMLILSLYSLLLVCRETNPQKPATQGRFWWMGF